jgi:hypothetical protein
MQGVQSDKQGSYERIMDRMADQCNAKKGQEDVSLGASNPTVL